MKRLLVNGSPRGRESNSRLILSWIAEGITGSEETDAERSVPVIDIARGKDRAANLKAFIAAEEAVIAFPLYTDSVPGIVKAFLEDIAEAGRTGLAGKRVAFVVQSGFPESIHSEAIAAYLERLCRRLGLVHAGTIIKGGVEGVRIMPDRMRARLKSNFVRAGRELATDGRFSDDLVRRMARPRRFGPVKLLAYRFFSWTGLANFYWNMMLRKHGAFERRFDAPYGEKATAP